MYPSSHDVRYGIFIKRFEDAVKDEFDIKRLVLTKKSTWLSKVIGYLMLYFKLGILFFTCKKNDIIYVHFPLYFSLPLSLLAIKGAPLALNFHGSDAIFNTKLKVVLSWFLSPVVKKSDKIVAPSNYFADKLNRIFDVERAKIYVYPSGGINAEIFYPKKEKQEGFTFGFISNFIESKGWKIFLRAISLIIKAEGKQDFSVVMVGDGPDKNAIIDTVEKNGIKAEIVSYIPQEKLVDIYARFDAFIFPTYREEESLGLVGLEAMMCGVPVIAGKVGGPLGYVQEGFNGFLFDKKDSLQLSKKMQYFRSLGFEQKAQMGRNCIATAKNYESNLVNRELVKMLHSLLLK